VASIVANTDQAVGSRLDLQVLSGIALHNPGLLGFREDSQLSRYAEGRQYVTAVEVVPVLDAIMQASQMMKIKLITGE
jgi:hypothetical protein